MKLNKHFGQCSNIQTFFVAKDKGEKKLFGFAFTPLMREDGTTLSDESHELYIYKVRQTLRYVKHIIKKIIYIYIYIYLCKCQDVWKFLLFNLIYFFVLFDLFYFEFSLAIPLEKMLF